MAGQSAGLAGDDRAVFAVCVGARRQLHYRPADQAGYIYRGARRHRLDALVAPGRRAARAVCGDVPIAVRPNRSSNRTSAEGARVLATKTADTNTAGPDAHTGG